MVAPNGARLLKSDHQALPLTLPEIVADARACARAGAAGLHLHLRDAAGLHVLDAGLYREALAELGIAVPGMALQITTEAVGRYGAPHQRQVALESGASMVSAALGEMVQDTPEATAAAFYSDCAARGIAVQHILYGPADFGLLARLLGEELLRDPSLQLIFVLGRYRRNQNSAPADLLPFLDRMKAMDLTPDWAVCAFGRGETACLTDADRCGGKLRVGFENSLWNSDGSVAEDNAERVREILATCNGFLSNP
jgi:uncharacterized protein (DUF849 family)